MNHPRLGFIGPMVGRHPGYVTTQVQILSDLFRESGYPVIGASSKLNRYLRMADIVGTLLKNRKKIDILVMDVFGGPSFVVEDVASLIAKASGIPIIMVLRGGAMPEFMARFPKWTARVLKRAQKWVAPSSFLKEKLQRYGYEAVIIPNVLDLNHYSFHARRELRPRLIWMRAFHPVWNPLMAVRVLKRVQAKVPGAQLVMAGQDKGLEAEVQKYAEENGVNGGVKFVGFLDRAGKKREFQEADIYINTNHIDNMPVTVLEAGAFGLPVVSTNVGGIPDLLKEGETALLVKDNDDEAMAQAILKLLEHPDLAQRLSVNGRKLAENSSWDQVRPQWHKLFERVIRNG
jgi:L-malate glycosyltransferase